MVRVARQSQEKKEVNYMKMLSIKKILIVISITIIFFALILGVRYLKYYNFIGKFTSDKGDYYKFNLFSWSYSNDGTNKQKCSLWNCNIEKGLNYYIKDNRLYLSYDKHAVFITNYKIEKKNNKTYLYFYDDSNKLEYTYVKK